MKAAVVVAIACIAFAVADASLVGGAALIPPSAVGVVRPGLIGPGVLGLGGLGGLGIGGLGIGGLGVGRLGLGLPGLVGSGIEGQWIPDINEKLYDDGSYRAEHHLAGHLAGW